MHVSCQRNCTKNPQMHKIWDKSVQFLHVLKNIIITKSLKYLCDTQCHITEGCCCDNYTLNIMCFFNRQSVIKTQHSCRKQCADSELQTETHMQTQTQIMKARAGILIIQKE